MANRRLRPKVAENGTSNVLTRIHRRIHCAATRDATEEESELDCIAIDHFLDTLAEIALSVARAMSKEDS